MISEKHSQAARSNGARSRGPVTPQGKATSSRNATRHGLLAKIVVLSNEDETLFEANVDQLIARFNPADQVEMAAVEEMAAAHWRLRRNMAIEHAIIESGIASHPANDSFQQSAAAFSDPASGTTLARLQRYETRLQNIYQRAARTLTLLRKMPSRKSEPDPNVQVPNEPKTTNVCTTDDSPTARPKPPAQPTPLPEPPFSPAPTTIANTSANSVPFAPFVFP